MTSAEVAVSNRFESILFLLGNEIFDVLILNCLQFLGGECPFLVFLTRRE